MIEIMKNEKPMKRVLIVDDSEQILERLSALLCESPYINIVGQARNGREAREAVKELRPDTVILDIRLPDSSGIDLLKEIKVQFSETEVIMLTNFDYDRYRRQCRELGADYFLNKTLEFEKILDIIVGDTIN
jgi:DNA-binding NarL/FixJ family response regulator